MKKLGLILPLIFTAGLAHATIDFSQIIPHGKSTIVGTVGWVNAEFGKDKVEVVIMYPGKEAGDTYSDPVIFSGPDKQAGLYYYTMVGKKVTLKPDSNFISKAK